MPLLPVELFLLSWTLVTCLVPVAVYCFARGWLDRRRRYQPVNPEFPPITLVKPMRGASHALLEHLASTYECGYPNTIELICAVEDPDDPATLVVAELQKRFPDQPIRVVVSYGAESIFGKHANLIAGYQASTYDIVVFSDADVRLEPGQLQELIPPLSDPRVGCATTGFYQDWDDDLPTALMAMFVATWAWVPNMATRYINQLRYAIGGLMAFRKDVLEELGGLAAIIAHRISDDAALGKTLRDNGYALYLASFPYHVRRKEPSVRAVVANIHRWMLMWRTQGRKMWAHPLWFLSPFPVIAWLLSWATGIVRPEVAGWTLLAVLLWQMGWGAITIQTFHRGRKPLALLFLSRPVAEMLMCFSYVWAVLWPFTVWGGRVYRVYYPGDAELVDYVEPLAPITDVRLRERMRQRLTRSRAAGRRAVRLLRQRLSVETSAE
ncbi:MAG: glycosyltransferase [bacterium]